MFVGKLIGEADGYVVSREFEHEASAIHWAEGAGLIDFEDQTATQALVADNITTGTPSQSSPARTPGNLLTTGGQKAMEILDGDLVAVGGKKEK